MSSKNDITARKEEAMPALVPKLRFPEFREADAWEPTTIGALGRFYYGKSAPKWSLAEDAPTPCVRYGELYTKFGPVITETYSRTNTAPETLRFSKGGEILIPRVGEKPEDFGKCCAYLPLKGIAIGEMISVLETRQHPLFYTYYFRNLHRQFAKVVEGQNVKNLYFAELEPLPIHRPSLPEQQKIAECLSSVDELMAAQARKVDALKTHKKGLMQQLFPREGETQPRLRFPEFRDAGAWSKRKLSNFLTERSQFPENKVPLYSLTIEDGVTPKTERYERAFLVNDEAEAYKLVLPNDFAFNPMNLRFGAIGRHSGTEAVAVSKYYNIFYCDNSVDSRFCDIYFRSDAMVRFYDTMAIGSLIEKRRVHFSDFLKFNIRFPSSLEQQRIADCIASLDTLITATIQELEALKIHKKGLMQQLFPQGETLS